MWVYRIKKPTLEDKVYETKELYDKNLTFVSVENAKNEMSLFEQLIPYTVTRNVLTSYYNKEKMIADYNLPKESYIGMVSNEGVRLYGDNAKGEHVSQFISRQEIVAKYIITESVPHYIWQSSEEMYWRKAYDIQDWFYDSLDHVENCGYYILDADLIAELNMEFDEEVSEDDPTDDEALFYHEWY